jgi:hypothetical protein
MYAPGEEVVIALGFEYEGDGEIESVEAVFVREGLARRSRSSGTRVRKLPAEAGRRVTPRGSGLG